MNDVEDVKAAAAARAEALARRDSQALRAVLHPHFVWTSHRGGTFDVDSYVTANSGAGSRWLGQTLHDVRVTVVGSTAVLVGLAVDEVESDGGTEVFTMPVTQTWVREGERWLCLAGHAGPRQSSR